MGKKRYQSWRYQKERGSFLLTKAMVWVILRMRPFVARFLLYPICAYFLIFSRKARKASYSYLSKALNRPPGVHHIYIHFFTFAQSLVDRVFFLTSQFDNYKLEVSGIDVVDEISQKGRGCILLGSHLGSFDLVRAYGKTYRNLSVKIMMDEKINPGTTDLFQSLDPNFKKNLISVGSPESILKIKELLGQGTFVGMLGDRIFDPNKFVTCNFMGGKAPFPTGPILLSAILHVPVVLFFGLRLGKNHYKIYFEKLSDNIILNKENQDEEIKYWVEKYLRRLEYYTYIAPYNWFNFFDIWDLS